MSYIVIRSFYEGNTLHAQGEAFEPKDQEYLKKCLDDGNVTDDTKGEAATTAVLEAKRAAVVHEQETEKHDAIQSGAKEAAVDGAAPLDSPVAPTTPESPVQPPQPPVAPAPGQPTQAQIDEALASAGTSLPPATS